DRQTDRRAGVRRQIDIRDDTENSTRRRRLATDVYGVDYAGFGWRIAHLSFWLTRQRDRIKRGWRVWWACLPRPELAFGLQPHPVEAGRNGSRRGRGDEGANSAVHRRQTRRQEAHPHRHMARAQTAGRDRQAHVAGTRMLLSRHHSCDSRWT